jgi:site-specific recombinase XerD
MTIEIYIPARTAIEDAAPPTLRAGVLAWVGSVGSERTRDGYRHDALCWFAFCAEHGIDPADVRRGHADAWRSVLEGEGLAPATIARRLAAMSSMYAYLLDEEIVGRNPFARVRRPKRSTDHSTTPALSDVEARALMTAASGPRESARTTAAVALLLTLGLRISELVSAQVEDLGHERGHRTLTVIRKGGARQSLPIPPAVVALLDEALDGRETGPLIATDAGRPVDRVALFRTVRRLAQAAGIPSDHVGPHALRRTVITLLLDDGVPLRDVQKIAGHADSRTTAGYDRSRKALVKQAAALASLAAEVLPPSNPETTRAGPGPRGRPGSGLPPAGHAPGRPRRGGHVRISESYVWNQTGHSRYDQCRLWTPGKPSGPRVMQ